MIAKGFKRYTPDNAIPGVIYIQDSLGRDWYDLRTEFSTETMKYAFDSNNNLLCFAKSIRLFPPIGTVAECPLEQWPAFVTINRLWHADADGVRCRVDDVPKRMGELANAFASLVTQYPDIDACLREWQLTQGWPYVPFPRFAPKIISILIDQGKVDPAEYACLTQT